LLLLLVKHVLPLTYITHVPSVTLTTLTHFRLYTDTKISTSFRTDGCMERKTGTG